MLSAMRFGFGGRIERNESLASEPKAEGSQGRSMDTACRRVARCMTTKHSGSLQPPR